MIQRHSKRHNNIMVDPCKVHHAGAWDNEDGITISINTSNPIKVIVSGPRARLLLDVLRQTSAR